MKITCGTQPLFEACSNVQRAVSGKTSIPALEGILFKAAGEEVRLSGFDLEIGISTSVGANVSQPGEIVLNARLLCDILRKLPGESVVIESDERHLTKITSSVTEYSLIGISAEDYPELPVVSGGMPITIERNLLRDMIKKTIFAAAVNDSKPVITGVRFEITEGKIRLIALDGYRMAVSGENLKYDGEELQFVVPAKTLSEISKIFGEGPEDISIGVGKRHISFEAGSYSVVSRLLDGEFLDYNSAIPTSFTTKARVKTKDFLDSIERTSLLVVDKIKNPMRCIFDENIIKISTTTTLGKAFDQTEAGIEGERVEIGFNNRYMIDALNAVDTDEIIVELGGPVSPAKILPPEGDSFLFLVLPVRLRND